MTATATATFDVNTYVEGITNGRTTPMHDWEARNLINWFGQDTARAIMTRLSYTHPSLDSDEAWEVINGTAAR